MGLGLLAGEVVVGQGRAHTVPVVFGHQRCVQAVVGGSLKGDLPFVVEVGQDAVHR